MHMIKIFFVLSLISTSLWASSGNEVGNGGDALVCKLADKSVSVQLFDFFEYQNQHSESIEERTGDYKTISLSLVDQLRKHDVKLAKLLSNRIETFIGNTQFVAGANLKNIKDSNNLITSPNKDCQIEQIAILKKAVLANEKKFLINNTLWEKLSETNKAGLILHELIYEYFSDLGEKNSVNARALNSFLFSGKFSEVTTDGYWQYIKSMKVPHYK